jgi:hypothetical protein
MDNFLTYWFAGFQKALSRIDDKSKKKILKECGQACSDSYTRQVFLDAKSNAASESEFIDNLKKAFPEIVIEIIEKDRVYGITYTFCACDLIKEGYISAPAFCECSRCSLQYNWEALYGEGHVEVEMIQTILEGADCCRFIVTLH